MPPRIGVRTTSSPSARIARSASATTSGNVSMWRRMFEYWRLDLDLEPRARLGGDDLGGGAREQRHVAVEQLVVEVAHDRAHHGAARRTPATS